MATIFAQIRAGLQVRAFATVLALTACASLPPPTAELATARQAVARAGDADADQYAADEVSQARRALELAQAAMAQGREDDARSLAVQAAAVADLAHAYSRKAVADTKDRKSVVSGKGVSVRVDLGGRRIIKKKKPTQGHQNKK